MLQPVITPRLDFDAEAAIRLQEKLAGEVVLEDRLPREIRFIAGVDVAYDAGTSQVEAAVAVVRQHDLAVVETAVARSRASFPYVPGLFAFREIPPIILALEKIEQTPDVILCDGHGRSHPRRFGLASHLGFLYDVPTVGCAKTRLTGEGPPPGLHRGDYSELVDVGEVVGAMLRTREGVKPVYVSQGHRISLPTACSLVLGACAGYRIPEPLREANRLANQARASWRVEHAQGAKR